MHFLNAGESVDVVGTTIGRGFAGVVKRHGFTGLPEVMDQTWVNVLDLAAHIVHREELSRVKDFLVTWVLIHQVMRNLEVVSINQEANVVLVKGSVPGKIGSLLCIRKS